MKCKTKMVNNADKAYLFRGWQAELRLVLPRGHALPGRGQRGDAEGAQGGLQTLRQGGWVAPSLYLALQEEYIEYCTIY